MANRGGDEVDDGVFSENVHLEAKGGERGPDELTQDSGRERVELGGSEVEEHILRARGVLQD